MGLLIHWRYTWYDQIILEFTEVSPAPEWPCQGSVVPLGPIAPALTPVSEEDVTVCGRRKQIKFQILPIHPYTEYYNQKWPDFTVLEEIPFWCDPQLESMQVYGIITGILLVYEGQVTRSSVLTNLLSFVWLALGLACHMDVGSLAQVRLGRRL